MFETLIKENGFWTLSGVLLGFSLNIIYDFFRKRCRAKQLKKLLRDEMISNQHQIKDKINILNQIYQILTRGKVGRGDAIPFAMNTYNTHFSEILTEFTPIERDNIRNIYGRFQKVDYFLDTFYSSFKTDMKNEILAHPIEAYRSQCEDLKNFLYLTSELISKLISGKAENIYRR